MTFEEMVKSKLPKGKAIALVVDTGSKIAYDAYAGEQKKINYDKWRDYGVDYYNFYIDFQKLGFEVVQVLGEFGSGKSFGIKGFEKGEAFWFNVDNKNPTWKGGREIYGTKLKPHPGYNFTKFKTYDTIIHATKTLIENKVFNTEDGKPPIAFILSHIQDYKSGDVEYPIKQQLKMMGNQARELGIEGLVENTLYSKKVVEGTETKYYFQIESHPSNTIRVLEGLFDGKKLIPNDLKLVADAIRNY